MSDSLDSLETLRSDMRWLNRLGAIYGLSESERPFGPLFSFSVRPDGYRYAMSANEVRAFLLGTYVTVPSKEVAA